MNDRERLAADLHKVHICVEMPDGRCITDHTGAADRLIALGWTTKSPLIDEERLERAIRNSHFFSSAENPSFWPALAAAIAKAYREDKRC